MQHCSNSIANALELLQCCTKPSKWNKRPFPLYISWFQVTPAAVDDDDDEEEEAEDMDAYEESGMLEAEDNVRNDLN